MAVSGSDRALQIIGEEGDADYERYEESVEALREEFSSADWSRNLYWSWLDALRILIEPRGEGYPDFMRTLLWEDRQLQTALASWAELRHDTILYAKQSYTPELTAVPPTPGRGPAGFVEPIPELYERLEALVDQTLEELGRLGCLTEEAESRLNSLGWMAETLREIAEAELRGEELSEAQEMFIREVADEVEGVLFGLDERTRSTVLVADVHTDQNTGMVLEEGVGRLDLIVVAFPTPEGRVLAAGPVLSYYEFKVPMSERLTDEAWAQMLEEGPPDLAPWQERLYGR